MNYFTHYNRKGNIYNVIVDVSVHIDTYIVPKLGIRLNILNIFFQSMCLQTSLLKPTDILVQYMCVPSLLNPLH